MSADRVVLWRHGQTDLNVAGRIQGSQDFPLNETGREQARSVAVELAQLNPAMIVSSPLSRALDTARALGGVTGLDVEVDARLVERCYGEWEGLTREDMVAANPREYAVWRAGGHPEGLGVERNSVVADRIQSAVWDAAAKMDGGTLIVVAHGAALRAGVTAMLGMDPEGWTGLRGMDNCHWAMLVPRPERTPEWLLISYNRAKAE